MGSMEPVNVPPPVDLRGSDGRGEGELLGAVPEFGQKDQNGGARLGLVGGTVRVRRRRHADLQDEPGSAP